MKVVLDDGARMPTKAHESDAGLDLYARNGEILRPHGGSAVFDTGVHVAIPSGYVGILKSKSGLNIKYGITSDGLIDSGYTGSIRVKLYNHGSSYYTVDAGDKISQLVILPICTETMWLAESLRETERGDNGFGSSGK